MRLPATDRWRTGRIECRILELDDVSQRYVDWLNDPQVNRYLESRFEVHTLGTTRAFVATQLADPSALFLGIHSLELSRHVGNIKLGPIQRPHGLAEVGIMIGDRDAWGRGIASEAISVIAAIARDEMGLRKLTAGCYRSNGASQRAFVKAGFQVEAVRPRHFLLDGREEDLVLLGRWLDGKGG
jgi:[ribosomal protein S5]-alanine N-acetyltransferase